MVLERESADAWTSGRIYVVVVQAVLLYVLEMWVVTPRIAKVLGGFHHRVACRLIGRQTCRGRDGRWVYPPLEEVI